MQLQASKQQQQQPCKEQAGTYTKALASNQLTKRQAIA
jgi:hypothetical protein